MRTTLTLDPDVRDLVERAMSERGIGFKQAVNDAIRAGLAPPRATTRRTRTFSMGEPPPDLVHALRLAGEIEDEELMRKLRLGK